MTAEHFFCQRTKALGSVKSLGGVVVVEGNLEGKKIIHILQNGIGDYLFWWNVACFVSFFKMKIQASSWLQLTDLGY